MFTMCTLTAVALVATDWSTISEEILIEILRECLTTILHLSTRVLSIYIITQKVSKSQLALLNKEC